MPKLEQGDLEAVEALMRRNIPHLAKLAREGYAILTPVPSCTLMYKQELPLMFPEDESVKAVRDAMFDPFEYLMARRRDGLLKNDYKQPLGKVAYHVPCHSRVQLGAMKTGEALREVPGTEVTVIERCSGHAGTWGVKKEFHQAALKIGRPVVRQIAELAPDYFSSDCQLAAHHLEEGLERAEGKGNAKLRHPLTLMRIAYGLPD
jgi:Fe-S oxidoreductase